jgi:phosphatidylserine/phosphatidylglycerophosphate/cardiolipin synthase-like enzyme
MRDLRAQLLVGADLHTHVVRQKMLKARSSIWISTANVKAMMVEWEGAFVPLVEALASLARKGVETRLLHAEKPSRPFREALEKHQRALGGKLEMRVCPRVHFKLVMVDGNWAYLGSANLTGAGLGAKDEHRRNFEVGFATSDVEVLDHASALFMSVWSGAECGACKLYDLCPSPLGPQAPGARRPRRKKAQGLVQLGRARKFPKAG